MKKLMITAATAAMVGGVFAAECLTPECAEEQSGATAYTLSLSLKTTTPKTKISGDKCCEDCTYWNVQKTMKYSGIIWGAAECSGCTMMGEDLSMLIWNTTTKAQVDADLALYLGRYEKKLNKAEAYGTIAGDDFGSVAVAGFGSVYLKTIKEECAEAECYSYVKSLSGNAAGYLVRAVPDDCEEIAYDCCDDEKIADTTAASGTWKVSYTASVAKKLAKQGDDADITQAYKVPSYVDADESNEVIIEE